MEIVKSDSYIAIENDCMRKVYFIKNPPNFDLGGNLTYWRHLI